MDTILSEEKLGLPPHVLHLALCPTCPSPYKVQDHWRRAQLHTILGKVNLGLVHSFLTLQIGRALGEHIPFSHGALFGSGGYVASVMVPVGFWKTSTAQSALQSNLGNVKLKAGWSSPDGEVDLALRQRGVDNFGMWT
ncbi:unnamed protein product [Sphagnum jensenii]|uniref:Uncharacterized protein n=1 Tax=Sphagnum jensenii TaxID=128206 RepID=A0ABP1BA56_9BRYO